METLTFTPSRTFHPKTNLQTIIQNLPAPIISEEKNIWKSLKSLSKIAPAAKKR